MVLVLTSLASAGPLLAMNDAVPFQFREEEDAEAAQSSPSMQKSCLSVACMLGSMVLLSLWS